MSSQADISVQAKEQLTAQQQLETLCINTIRTLAMDAVQKANSGHPGTPMALAPLAFVLWDRFLRHNPHDPHWPGRDRFILSNGHACMLLYAMLHLTGYDLSLDDIKQFRQWGSKTPGHPEYHHVPGLEVTTGPLGQGVSNSVGMAMAQRWLASTLHKGDYTPFDYRIYAFCGDGDLMEGVSNEAASVAGHLGLSNLIWFYDNNHITIEGHTSLAFTDDVATRFEGWHWNILHVTDVNDLNLVDVAIRAAQREPDRPTLIICDTHIGWGSPDRQDTKEAHGEALGVDEVRKTKIVYGWPPDAQFLVPDEVQSYMSKAIERGAKWEQEWDGKYQAWAAQNPDPAKMWQQMSNQELPAGWDKDIPTFPADAKGLATRDSSAKVENAVAARVPWLIGGAADLYPSTKTLIKDGGDFEKDNHCRPQLPLRHPRACHGLNPEWHGALRCAALWSNVLYLLRLHAASDSPGCDDGAAGHLHLHARFHRSRRRRPYSPVDRATHVVAGHAPNDDHPPRRRQRGRRSLARHHADEEPARGAGAHSPGRADLRSHQVRARPRAWPKAPTFWLTLVARRTSS